MEGQKRFKTLPGSKPVITESEKVEDTSPDEEIQIILRLRKKKSAPSDPGYFENMGYQLPKERKYYSVKELEEAFGFDEDDLQKVRDFARDFQLDVLDENSAQRLVTLKGTPKELNEAFQINLENYDHASHHFRSHRGEIQIPEELEGIVKGVFGLDNQYAVDPRTPLPPGVEKLPGLGTIKNRYTPQKTARAYQFPKGGGKGQSIAVIALGGGYYQSDIEYYLKNVENVNVPQINEISVMGAQNSPGVKPGVDPQQKMMLDFEITMDVQIVASIANEATINVYFAPNTDAGWIAALEKAIMDEDHDNSVITMSFGTEEKRKKSALVQTTDAIFRKAAARGITVCLPSGNSGSGDNTDGYANVEFPSSSPFALCCGGSTLTFDQNEKPAEVVWNQQINLPGMVRHNASTGGVSEYFTTVPFYQKKAGIKQASVNPGAATGRAVPDVAGCAGFPGYKVYYNGSWTSFPGGGTSSVAPLWAGLIAIINERLGTKAGFINPHLYQPDKNQDAFSDITNGNNIMVSKGYHASKGWDACTGWGSPIGEKLLELLGG